MKKLFLILMIAGAGIVSFSALDICPINSAYAAESQDEWSQYGTYSGYWLLSNGKLSPTTIYVEARVFNGITQYRAYSSSNGGVSQTMTVVKETNTINGQTFKYRFGDRYFNM